MRRTLRVTAGVLAAAFASFLGLLALRRAWSAVLSRRPARAMPEADGDDELPVLRGGRSSSTPREPTELVPTHAAPWALPGEEAKDGVGMLFFAYGGTKQVDAFLAEATAAAASIREFNPNLSIAIVTNNASVNRRVFTTHIVPRDDLVFPGSKCPDVCRPDHVARQWTTRLYYMALSPYRITWALDSNTMQCPGERAHGAIHRFLLAAERTAMWGVDIAHANLLNPLNAPMGAHAAARRNLMSPHCFSLLWKWNGRTSNVFRDWFMLMLRRGVATNDQEPLRYAEVRQQRMGAGGLTVGQIPTEFAGSLYTSGRAAAGSTRASRALSAALCRSCMRRPSTAARSCTSTGHRGAEPSTWVSTLRRRARRACAAHVPSRVARGSRGSSSSANSARACCP